MSNIPVGAQLLTGIRYDTFTGIAQQRQGKPDLLQLAKLEDCFLWHFYTAAQVSLDLINTAVLDGIINIKGNQSYTLIPQSLIVDLVNVLLVASLDNGKHTIE